MSQKGICPTCNQGNEYTKVVCDFCGARLPWASALQRPAPTTPTPANALASTKTPRAHNSGLRLAGLLFIGLGVIGLAYFLIVFDTSVAVPITEIFGQTIGGGRVNNLGLMQERQNGLMLSGGAFALGVILMAIDQFRPKD